VFCIFIVFFVSPKSEKMHVKVTKYLKVPYANNSLDLFRMQCKPYKNVHDGLYYAKAYDHRTYFYFKNDLITYDRRLNSEVATFAYELLSGSYNAIKFNKLKGIIRDEDAFWIIFNNQVKFFVSRDTELQDQNRYVTVASVSDGHFLLRETKKNEIYLRFLSIFYGIMLPVIHVKENGIFVHLLDLLNENSYSMSWYLNDIKALINTAVKEDEAPKSYRRIKETILYDTITEIKESEIKSYHEHVKDEDSNDFRYLTIIFELNLEGENYKYDLNGLVINIKSNGNILSGILHFNRRDSEIKVLKKSTKWHLVYSVESTLSSLSYIGSLFRTYTLSKNLNNKTSKIEITIRHDIIYDDGCHYLMRSAEGIIVRRSEEYMMYIYRYNPSLIYRYKQYIFITGYGIMGQLIVIDTKNNLIVVFSASSGNLRSLTEYKVLYFFYPIEKYEKLIFIHNSLNYIMILNTTKLKQVLDRIKTKREINGCGESWGYDVVDVINMDYICKVYYMPDLILDSIQSKLDFNITDIHLNILGHYFDNQNCKLYFMAKLIGEDIHTTALLVWSCSEREVRFKLVCYDNNDKNNVAIKVSNCKFKNLTNNFIFMNNMDLYGVALGSDRFNKFDSLYLDINRFVDVGYYRFSCRLYSGNPSLKIDRIGNLILMKHKAIGLNKEDDGDIDADSSFCFVLSRLQLVRSMRHVVV